MKKLLADGVAEVDNVHQFIDEANECIEHGIAPMWLGACGQPDGGLERK